MSHDEPPRPALPPELRDAVERAAAELFIGRERERTQLEAALQEALGGRGRLCLIAGEPGIGKTRLAEWVAARAAEHGANVIWGRCWEGEVSSAYGLGGRVRKAGDVGERARKAVTSRIRESIDRIGKEHAALARHFENAIRTGTFCSYRPDRPLRWVV